MENAELFGLLRTAVSGMEDVDVLTEFINDLENLADSVGGQF